MASETVKPAYRVSVFGIHCYQYELDPDLYPVHAFLHPLLWVLIRLHELFRPNSPLSLTMVEDYRETPSIVLHRLKDFLGNEWKGAPDAELLIEGLKEYGVAVLPVERIGASG